MVTTNKTGSLQKRKVSWIFSGLFGILGLLILFSSTTAGVLVLILAFVISPRGTRTMAKVAPNFRTGWKKWVSYIGLFIVILIVFMASGPSIKGKLGEYQATIYPSQGTHDEGQVQDFAYTLAQLLIAYQAADTLEYISLDFSPLDFTGDGYSEMMGAISAKRKEVSERNDKLYEFAKYAEDEFSYIDIKRYTYSPFAVYAIGAEDAVDRALTAQPSEEFKAYQADQEKAKIKEKNKKVWEDIDTIKAGYPDKRWFEIVNARIGTAGKEGQRRMEERNLEDVKDMKDEVAYQDKREGRYKAYQTATKIFLWVGGMPKNIAVGGLFTASKVFLGGADIGMSVGDTIDIMMNGSTKSTIRKTITTGDKQKNLVLLRNVLDLVKNPKDRDSNQIMAVTKIFVNEFKNPKKALVFNVDDNDYMTVYDTTADDEKYILDKLGVPGESFSYFENPPVQGDLEGDDHFNVRVMQREALKEYIERPSTQIEIGRLKKLRAEERARKEAEYQKINAAAAQARKRTEINKRAQSEPAIKETLEKLNIDTTPPPTPVVPTTPSVAPGTITTCSVCMSAGLECACGKKACRCCNPGDDSCNGFDL